MSTSSGTKKVVPWNSLLTGTSSLEAPGPPDISTTHPSRVKKRETVSKKLAGKLNQFDTSSGSRSDGSSSGTNSETGVSNGSDLVR